MPKIAVDAMGSDNYPEPEIEAVIHAAREYGEEILLVGQEQVLKPKLPAAGNLVRIVHADDVFSMKDQISAAALRNSQSSMAVGMRLMKAGEVDAFITMGNTGGAMANGLFALGRIRGVKRPALTAQGWALDALVGQVAPNTHPLAFRRMTRSVGGGVVSSQ